MVAITTDTRPYPQPELVDGPPARLFEFPSRPAVAGGGRASIPDATVRFVAIVALAVAVVVVSIGFVALGRALDSQRGIPAAIPASAAPAPQG